MSLWKLLTNQNLIFHLHKSNVFLLGGLVNVSICRLIVSLNGSRDCLHQAPLQKHYILINITHLALPPSVCEKVSDFSEGLLDDGGGGRGDRKDEVWGEEQAAGGGDNLVGYDVETNIWCMTSCCQEFIV